MNELEFTLNINPPKATAQQKGAFIAGKVIRFFKKKKVVEAERSLGALLYEYAPQEPFQGAVKLTIDWYFPYRKSERKSIVKSSRIFGHTVRPDLDNLEKSFIDVMTRLQFWNDDSQICVKHTRKYWAPKGKIHVKIESACDE